MYRFFDKSAPDEFWLEGTLELLRRCDGIVMTEGWQRSEGSKGELGFAREHQMLAWETIERFEVWADVYDGDGDA
jgi:hypothetical protein